MKRISIILPTVEGRESYFDLALRTYTGNATHPTEVIVVRDQPTCGRAWNMGAELAQGDFLHSAADDVEFAPAWDVEAARMCQDGAIPAPCAVIDVHDDSASRHLEPGQSVTGQGADISVAPFCSAAQWRRIGPFIDCHYFTDSWFTHRAILCGYPVLGCSGFSYRHHLAPVRRGAGMSERQRMVHDQAIYEKACGW